MSFWRVSGGPRKQASWLRPCCSFWGSHLLVLWFDGGGAGGVCFFHILAGSSAASGVEKKTIGWNSKCYLKSAYWLWWWLTNPTCIWSPLPHSVSVCLSIRPSVSLSVHSFIMHASSDLKSGWIPAGGKDSFEQIKRTMSQTFGSLSSFRLPNVGKTSLARREEHRTWPAPWEASFLWFLSYCLFFFFDPSCAG